MKIALVLGMALIPGLENPAAVGMKKEKQKIGCYVVLDNAKIAITKGTKVRLSCVQNNNKYLVRFEFSGVVIEVPHLAIEIEDRVCEIEACQDGSLRTRSSPKK
jgi:hypothetical protein